MPGWESMLVRANTRLSYEGLRGAKVDDIPGDASLTDIANMLGIAVSARERSHIASWPQSVQDAIRASLVSAVSRGIPVSMSWAPDYDYSVRVYETQASRGKRATVQIALRGPYEGRDPSPVLRAKRR